MHARFAPAPPRVAICAGLAVLQHIQPCQQQVLLRGQRARSARALAYVRGLHRHALSQVARASSPALAGRGPACSAACFRRCGRRVPGLPWLPAPLLRPIRGSRRSAARPWHSKCPSRLICRADGVYEKVDEQHAASESPPVPGASHSAQRCTNSTKSAVKFLTRPAGLDEGQLVRRQRRGTKTSSLCIQKPAGPSSIQ